MVREDLINSAVSFLQDPSVAKASLDKRIAFLQSKNLTQEEIDISLARASEDPSYSAPSAAYNGPPTNRTYQQPPPPPPGYGGYQGYWQQPPPPEVPKRDWRDWFIMATVLGGVSYGVYFTAKRYIYPLIAPPTPPQLEQDKASIDEQFNRAFALLDQLNTDTTALKSSEEARTERLDAALADMEGVIASLKESSRRRDDDSRRIEDDVRGLRDLIPKALEAHKENTATQLQELGTELKSLKTLVANRMSAGTTPTAPRPLSSTPFGQANAATPNTSSMPPSPAPAVTTPTVPSANATGASTESSTAAASSAPSAPEKLQASNPYGRFNGRAAIPAWQMTAAKKNEAEERKDTSESGTVTEAGASAS